jgi:predicted transcriptional regulator
MAVATSPRCSVAEALRISFLVAPERAARINFATPELLWLVLTAKRWAILKAMCGQGWLSIREIASLVGRDVKAVHNDVRALTLAGVLDKTDGGKTIFPYQAVHVDFMLKAA